VARLLENDSLAADNVRFAVLPGLDARRALLITEGNFFIERVLASNPNLTLDVAAPGEATVSSRYDVVVCEGCDAPPAGAAAALLVSRDTPGGAAEPSTVAFAVTAGQLAAAWRPSKIEVTAATSPSKATSNLTVATRAPAGRKRTHARRRRAPNGGTPNGAKRCWGSLCMNPPWSLRDGLTGALPAGAPGRGPDGGGSWRSHRSILPFMSGGRLTGGPPPLPSTLYLLFRSFSSFSASFTA
jgi:hypothetical protein